VVAERRAFRGEGRAFVEKRDFRAKAERSEILGGVGVLIFPGEDMMHKVRGVEGSIGERPAEAFAGGQLSSSSSIRGSGPELDKASDGPGSSAQSSDTGPGIGFGGSGFGEQLGPVGDPVDEHAGLNISQSAGQCFIP